MNKVIYIIAIAGCLLAGGCKKFIDVNKDPNRPSSVQEPLILAPAELVVTQSLYAGNAATIIQEYVQAMALNQPVPNSGTYFMVQSDMNGDWTVLYASCLNNLARLDSVATLNGNTNYSAIAKILEAFCWGQGTDLWGDIPYTQALAGAGNYTPVYDKQEDIYKGIQQLLDDAIAAIAKQGVVLPGDDDYLYKGDMAKWQKLAYTLKARYYMHLTKAPGYNAATQADLALQALEKGMTANDDDLKFPYEGIDGQENIWYQTFLSTSTFVLASGFIDTLKVRNDPRLTYMAKPAEETGLYTGRQIGTPTGSLKSYSYPSDFYQGAKAYNYVVNYSEALFLKAEATLIKSGFAAAQPIYQQAILSHMTKLGVTSGAISTYMTARGTLTAANALQRIMEEKATANFLSVENFTDWRRTGFPVIKKVLSGSSEVPRRLLYPQVEVISNPQPQQSAKLTDRVWWDQQ